MKKSTLYLAILFFIVQQNGIAQELWTQKTDYPNSVSGAVGFAIGDSGFVGLGWDPIQTNAFWKYNPMLNSWTSLADFPGDFMGHAVSFTLNGKGYLGTGLSGAPTTFHNDFWEYDPVGDSWTQKADFSGVLRSEASGFSLNGKGYIGLGWNQTDGFLNDFWQYFPENDTWIKKADFPGTPRISASGFSMNGKGYFGLGYDATGQKNDIWEYDPDSNTWTQKTDFPGISRSRAAIFIIDNYCYLGTGNSDTGILNDFWKYDTTTDTWTQLVYTSNIARQIGIGFSIGDKGYIGIGGNLGAPYFSDFWEFNSSLLSVEEFKSDASFTVFPDRSSTKINIKSTTSLTKSKLIISNVLGQQVKEIGNLQGTDITVSVTIDTGFYIVQLIENEQQIALKKIIVN